MNRRTFIKSAGLAAAVLCLRFRPQPELPPRELAIHVYEYRSGSGWFVWETPSETPPWPDGRDGYRLISTNERRRLAA